MLLVVVILWGVFNHSLPEKDPKIVEPGQFFIAAARYLTGRALILDETGLRLISLLQGRGPSPKAICNQA
ncbi:hypothetical protein [Hyphococcus luteus]|uniref:Uncharacterized protein n=1 Tax=Hyphococcus luteus TaxID=2058213 RepID=A0A2S7K1H2_9PROT|nr:hypothetical protein [Marinicaulis flavus]PQA86349.1 hypothetical protein CW354_18595 [Marinicaulis flavus]